jgi:D-serine deaminase-like pyridoxal phosphate-dependent protein
VAITPQRRARAMALQRRGCALRLLTDSLAGAEALVAFGRAHGQVFEVLIEVDTDGHRAGLAPDAPELRAVAERLHAGGARLAGVLAHAGSSYELDDAAARTALAERERAGCVHAAQRLRAAGLPCPVVSVGSTPTALAAAHLDGVTELRAGVYVFFDLVMRNLGVCDDEDLALSVLTTITGHQPDKGWALVDAGWMAMSRDRGTAQQRQDFGYGQVCGLDGRPIDGCLMVAANQEHGIVAHPGAPGAAIVARFPLGTRLRILPNHACATGAQFGAYHALAADGGVQVWERFGGW